MTDEYVCVHEFCNVAKCNVGQYLFNFFLQILQNCDELFDRSEFSASPDVGWPDCFNSGVFVFKPSIETFDKLLAFAIARGSFDGNFDVNYDKS